MNACHRLPQANFPNTLARLPKLAVLDMKNNKFKCAPLPTHIHDDLTVRQ